MKKIIALPLLLAVAGPASAAAEPQSASRPGAERTCSQSKVTEAQARGLIEVWPETARRAAESMLARHGAPDSAGCAALEWRGAAPFARIVVTRDAVGHDFPTPHEDVVSHEVGLRVPADKLADLARFDGSLLVDRTKGTVTARSDSEPHNVALLNLARQIITGGKDAETARQEYASTVAKGLSGKESAASSSLQFSNDQDAGDVDQASSVGAKSGGASVPAGAPAPSDQDSVTQPERPDVYPKGYEP